MMMRRRFDRRPSITAAAFAALVVGLSAAGGGARAAPSALIRYDIPAIDTSISLPAKWTVKGKVVDVQAAADTQAALVAADLSHAAPVIFKVSGDWAPGITLAQQVRDNLKGFRSGSFNGIFVKIVGPPRKYVTLPGGRAWKLVWQWGLSKTKILFEVTQFSFVHGPRYYIFTFRTTPKLSKLYAAQFDAIARTISFPTPVARPELGRIVFYSDRDGPFDIYTMNGDGSGQTRLTTSGTPEAVDTPKEQSSLYPRLSPDGKTIAYQFYVGRPFVLTGQIWLMNADGSGQHPLTTAADGENVLPSWSPDGTRIAFASTRDGNFEIYVMNADGSNPQRLTNDPGTDYVPVWSPDGTKIAFASNRGGHDQVWIMNADGSDPHQLVTTPTEDRPSAWSPDGQTILFEADGANVESVGADGSGLTPLTHDFGSSDFPRWSPDGRRIVFSSDATGGTELYSMDPNGQNLTRLTYQLGKDTAPDWGPVPAS